MALRKNTNTNALSPELTQILARNGMYASLAHDGEGATLVVRSNDSPQLTYSLTQSQLEAITDWGTNYANKKAYNTFVSIVKEDFDVPKNFITARSMGSPVNMGQYGAPQSLRFTEGPRNTFFGRGGSPRGHFGGGYAPLGPAPIVRGYQPRMMGVGGFGFSQADDGHVALGPTPGKVSASEGFRYKGNNLDDRGADVLSELQLTLPKTPQRSTEPAIAYKDAISSDVYFTNEKFQEVLSSHGIILDAEAKSLTIQSEKVSFDVMYEHLSNEQLNVLTANSLHDDAGTGEKGYSVEERLGVINDIIKDDFADRVSFDELNGTSRISLGASDVLKADIDRETAYNNSLYAENRGSGYGSPFPQGPRTNFYEDENTAMVDGRQLSMENENKGWYREGAHGREVSVQEIRVERIFDNRDSSLHSSVEPLDVPTRPTISDVADVKQVEEAVVGQTLVFNQIQGADRETKIASIEEVLIPKASQEGEEKGVEEKDEEQTDRYYRLLDDKGNAVVVIEANELAQLSRDGFSVDEANQVNMSFKPMENYPQEETSSSKATLEAGAGQAKYRMTAVINGETISHEITQKQFDKFMAVDDFHRMKLFSKVFDEVDMKTRPEANTNVGAKIFAAFAATATILTGVRLLSDGPRHNPELYASHTESHTPTGVYGRDGFSNANDIAARIYNDEADRSAGAGMGLGR